MNNKPLLFAGVSCALAFFSTQAFAEETTPSGRFGLGIALYSAAPEYTDNDTGSAAIFPVYRGRRISVDHDEIAFSLLPDSAVDIELLTKRQHFGYDSQDAKVLEGMADRHPLWGVGARASYQSVPGKFSASVFHNPIDDDDVVGAESGSSAILEYGYPLRLGSYALTPVAGYQWYSEEVTDFLYGVGASEATPSRATFRGEDAAVAYVGLNLEGMITNNLRLSGGLRYESLSDEIADSPLVDEDATTRAHVGIAWMF